MKLKSFDLLEADFDYHPDWKKDFYEFQDKLIEVDETFEFVSVKHDILPRNGRDVEDIKVLFIRPKPSNDKPMASSIALTLLFRFDRLRVALYTTEANARLGVNDSFSKYADTVDEAIMYLKRMLT